MIGAPVARHTLAVHRPSEVENAHGNSVRTYPDAPTLNSAGWALDAGGTSESADGRPGIVYAYTARGPYAADVLDDDHIAVLGRTYEIDGGVIRQPGPSPLTSHTILQLRLVAG